MRMLIKVPLYRKYYNETEEYDAKYNKHKNKKYIGQINKQFFEMIEMFEITTHLNKVQLHLKDENHIRYLSDWSWVNRDKICEWCDLYFQKWKK